MAEGHEPLHARLRSREVSITRAGRAMIAKSRKYWRQAQRAFEDELGADTSATLRSLLGRVAAAEFPLA